MREQRDGAMNCEPQDQSWGSVGDRAEVETVQNAKRKGIGASVPL
jgi:hypothetical protein